MAGMTSSEDILVPLQRGKACIACRRRKTKCDGLRPVCTQCVNRGVTMDCEYTDKQGRTRIQALEDNLAQLQSRIRELESPSQPGDSMTLRDPYSLAPVDQRRVDAASSSMGPEWRESGTDELPHQLVQQSLDLLFAYPRSIGLAFDSTHSRSSLNASRRQIDLPCVAFANSLYLIAFRLSGNSALLREEETFLEETLVSLEDSILESSSGQNTLQIIQGKLLSAQYLFIVGRSLEGCYQLNGATSLALSCSLHRTVFPSSGANARDSVPSTTESTSTSAGTLLFDLPHALNITEQTERVNLFWIAYSMDCLWSMMTTTTLSRAQPGNSPWPAEIFENLFRNNYQPSSLFELRAMVSSLFKQSMRLQTSAPSRGTIEGEVQSIVASLDRLANIMEDFGARHHSMDDKVHLLVTKCIFHAIMVHLQNLKASVSNGNAANEVRRASSYAREMARLLSTMASWSESERIFCDPVLADLAVISARTFVAEIAFLKNTRPALETQHIETLLEEAESIVGYLRRCCGPSNVYPIYDDRAEEIEDILNGVEI